MQLFASWQHNYFLIHNPHQFAEDVFNAILVNLRKKKTFHEHDFIKL